MIKFTKVFRNLKPWILVFIIAATTAISPASASATADTDFYSSNDILFYNPDDTTCSSSDTSGVSSATTSADATANAKTIFEFLISTNFTTNGNKPMTAVQAAGVLGNVQSESGFTPSAIQHPPYDPLTAMNASIDNGFGIAQWSFARRVNLLNFATTKGADWTNLGLQLTFMENELDTTHNVFSTAFATASTPSQAATLWNQKYEVSADTSSNRLTQAEAWYNQFKSLAPATTTSDDSSSASDCGSSSTGGTGTGQCNSTSCTTGDGTAASVLSAAMSMVLPTRDAGIAACNSYCGGGPAQPAAYATALKQYNIPASVANQYYGACCATFVSTVLQVAGVENDFSTCLASAIHSYLGDHPELFKHVASGVTAITSDIQPGDILANDSDVYIYVGGNNVAGASYGQRMPDLQAAWQDGPRDVYRVVKAAA